MRRQSLLLEGQRSVCYDEGMTESRRRSKKPTTRELENRLVETVQRYELIFKATNDVLYELDLINGVVSWNDVLFERYGYENNEETATLEWWTSRIHPDDALRLEKELSEWFEGKHDYLQSEYRFRIADGSYIHVRDRGVVQREEDGSPIRIIGSLLDITRERQLERAKDEFISLVSHQLRTPLTSVRIYSDMLASGMFGDLEEPQQKYADIISQASVRLIKQVEDMVHISRVELGQAPSRPTLSNVNELVGGIVRELHAEATRKNITIDFIPDISIKDIPIDPSIFRQILTHYLTNSIRYVATDKGRITIQFTEHDENYELSVKDNGIGIPRESHRLVFGKFYRDHNTENIIEQGTGLGLYLVKLLADITGCSVRFVSSKRETVFFLHIPKNGMN